jgi:hypothetical protein
MAPAGRRKLEIAFPSQKLRMRTLEQEATKLTEARNERAKTWIHAEIAERRRAEWPQRNAWNTKFETGIRAALKDLPARLEAPIF